MNGSGKNGRKNSSNNGGSSGKNLSKNQHNHLNKPQSMDAFFFGNTSTVSNKLFFKRGFSSGSPKMEETKKSVNHVLG